MTDVVQHRSSESPKAQRKPSSPKAKGAVRAKSGCYTCRIRRKKCDERPDADGNCQTCVRLRLQCLGFGAKRPDWMRENNSVSELREKIKGFLAAQGMIKGHSGSGPRCAEQDPSVLVLSGDTGSSTPSPQTRTLSTSSGDSPRPSGPVTSYVRDGPMPYSSSGSDGSSYNLPSIYPPHSQQSSHIQHHQQLSPDSPMPRGTVHPDIMLPSFHHLPSHSHSHSQMLNSSLVTVNSPTTWNIPAPIKSSFGPLYHHNIYDDEDMSALHLPNITEYSIPVGAAPPSMTRFGNDALVEHYLRNVLKIQYILADPSIRDFIMPLADHEPTYHAICFLSSVHRHRMGGALRIMADDEEAVHRDNTKRALEVALNKSGGFSEGDAMAGLHCVSSYLFSGGRGPWEYFLNVACRWVSDILRHTNHNQSLHGVLFNSPESTRFIIRTTMWFDVIASVSLCRAPTFLVEYRELFGGQHAFISGEGYGSPSFSMMSVMGCDNRTFLSLAEISALAEWKEKQIRTGRLSAPELVKRGQEIEKELLNTFDTDSECTQTSFTNSEEADLDARRRLTAEVFRASARVYLHSVLSGDYPACPEIAEGVRDTIAALKRVPADQPLSSRSVVRSVVFPICIAGCLTDDKSQRHFLMAKLQEQEAESVGNCSEVQNLIKSVWRERDRKRIAVSWRDVMKANGPEILLV